MKEKKFILLYDLINTYQDLRAVFDKLTETLGGEPTEIGIICDSMVDIIIRTFGVTNDDPNLDYYLSEFYGMAEEDPEDIVSDMVDTIKLGLPDDVGFIETK
jgi:hypothetical protein